MKLTASDIKQALLHPDEIVREEALLYFALSFSRDREVFPLAVQAIQRYGWDAAFNSIWMLKNVAQTDEALLWLVGKLDGSIPLSNDAAIRISDIIVHADTDLLERHESRLMGCKRLRGDFRQVVIEKIRLLSVPGDACWKELEDLCERHKNVRDSGKFEFRRATRLTEAISREGDRHAERVLSVLSQKLENFESNPLIWLEIFVAELAGLIRLESSAPHLVAKLKDDHGDFMNEQCTYSLTRIGTNAAVEAIAEDFHAGPPHFQMYAASALRDMRGPNVVAKALELLKGSEDWDSQVKFIGTALSNFDAEGLRVATDLGMDDLPQLRRGLIATAVLTGESFPDLERLLEEEQKHQDHVQQRQQWLGGLQGTVAPRLKEPVVQPVKLRQKVGRNDQCPCGSGKKYKKCCMDRS